MGLPLESVQVPLDDIFSLQCVNSTTQLSVINKFSEDALNPTVHVNDIDVKMVSIPTPEKPLITGLCLDIEPLTTTLSVT